MEQQRPEQSPPPSSASVQLPAVLSYRRALLVEAADNCYRCGYPLLGIEDEQACPECGLLARRSRRTTDELHNTRPRWLRRISRGANLVLLAIIVTTTWPFVWLVAARPLYGIVGPGVLWYGVPLLGLLIGAVLAALGVWLLTGDEGYPPADRADRRLRGTLRFAACVPLMAVGVVVFSEVLMQLIMSPARRYDLRTLFSYLAWALCTVGMAPLPILLFLHLRGLAQRARSAHLAEHCLIVGVGTAASVLLFTGYSVVQLYAETLGLGGHWVSRSNVALGITVALATAGVLFVLWSLYLFVRFALAFRRAARELRGRWTTDDRSQTPAPSHVSAQPARSSGEAPAA